MPFMHSEGKPTHSQLERVTTGIPGLNEVISGGFPKGTINLISGPPGGGKTILCCQYLYQGIQEGDPDSGERLGLGDVRGEDVGQGDETNA